MKKKDSSKNKVSNKTDKSNADGVRCNDCGQYVAMKDRDSHSNQFHNGKQNYSYQKDANDPDVVGKGTEIKQSTSSELGFSVENKQGQEFQDPPNESPVTNPSQVQVQNPFTPEKMEAQEESDPDANENKSTPSSPIKSVPPAATSQIDKEDPNEEQNETPEQEQEEENEELSESDKKDTPTENPEEGEETETPNESDKSKTDSKKVKISDRLKGEFVLKIDKNWKKDSDGLHFSGILSMPRMSLNGWIYFPQELARQDSVTVPLYINHEEMFDSSAPIRGSLTTRYDFETWELQFDAIATDQEAIDGIMSGRFQSMSMGADWGDYDYIRGYYIPKDVQIKEGSLVDNPGVIGSDIDSVYVDHFRGDGKPQKFEKCKFNCRDSLKSSLEQNDSSSKSITMSDAKNTKTEEKKPESPKVDSLHIDAEALGKIVGDAVEKANKATLDAVDKIIQAKAETEKPQGTVDQKETVAKQRTAFYDAVTESLRKHQSLNWDSIRSDFEKKAGVGFDAIDPTALGTAAGQEWLEDITIIPSGLRAGLRSSCETVIIQKGASEVHFTLISTPTPVNGSAPTIPSDVSQTITDVIAAPVERITKQRLTDQAARFTQINLGQAIADTFRVAEMLDEDLNVLTTLDGISTGSLAGVVFAGGRSAENLIQSTDYFTHNLLAQARAYISKKGWAEALIPGRLACAMSPEQMEQLMVDSNVQRFIEWVMNGPAPIVDGFIPRLHGIDLHVTSQLPTGTGSGSPAITTQHAYVYVKTVAVGLGFTKDLTIESVRYPDQRATTLVGVWEIASASKAATAIVRIVTSNTLA